MFDYRHITVDLIQFDDMFCGCTVYFEKYLNEERVTAKTYHLWPASQARLLRVLRSSVVYQQPVPKIETDYTLH